jgi:hypothetical protein
MPINRTGRNNSGLLGRFGRTAATNAKISGVTGGSGTTTGNDVVRTYTGTTPVTVNTSGLYLSTNGHIQPTQNTSLVGPTHNDAGPLRVLIVGGGMSGQGGHESGGHGGGAIDTTVFVAAGPQTITIGAGGAQTPNGGNGDQNSAVGNSSAFGQTIPAVQVPSYHNNNFYGFNGGGQRATGGKPGNGPSSYTPTEGPVANQPIPGPNTAQNRRGGSGLYSDITGSGEWYGGGGGAAGGVSYETSKGGHGGLGGGGGGGTGPGGDGGQYGNPNGTLGPSAGPEGRAGGANTGGGGGSGGIGACGTTYCGGQAGGSGICIIRYAQ